MSRTPITDAIRITIAAGDWRSERDCTEAALNHADDMEKQLTSAQQTIEQLTETNRIANAHIGAIAEECKTIIAQKDAQIRQLREAAKVGEAWMSWWLSNSECDCEMTHNCGLPERRKELEFIQKALSTPSPSAMVPWEVVEEYINNSKMCFSSDPVEYVAAQEKARKAWLKLQSYAPKASSSGQSTNP